MDGRTLVDLGHHIILDEVQQLCLSNEGRHALQSDVFLYDADELSRRQDIVEDLMEIATYGIGQPVSFPDLDDILEELVIPTHALDGNRLYDLGTYIEAARTFVSFCRTPRKFPGESGGEGQSRPAMELFGPFDDRLAQVAKEIFSTLESPGTVKSTHPAIARLTKEVERRRAERQTYSKNFLREQQGDSMNVQPLYRDGRVVLPVRSDNRSQTAGIVHSTSSSGATIFMEPYRLVELNNLVVMAQQQIEIEVARILAELTQKVRSVLDILRELLPAIAFADGLYARGRYAKRHACVRPAISEEGSVKLLQARHPLLRDKAVPITLELDRRIKAVVISGPNAGGKTVTIKTVGLFALMHQSIYFVPAAEGTVLPMYRTIFTDIGDDQSIEESLSTFSGHMKRIGSILSSCDDFSLVILDELGSGTDPVEGSALARAILEYCVSHAALTLVTSHHGVLKQYAYAHPDLLNASMEFDGETHEPTFKVISGLPGESHALDTARRMRLPKQVLERAQSYLGSETMEISTIIKGLEEKRREAQLREQALDARARKLGEDIRRNDLKRLSLKQQEQLLRNEQIGDLSRFISEKRSELENLVAQLREGEITREKTRKVKRFIASMEEKESESRRKVDEMEDLPEENDGEHVFEVGMDVLAGPHKREGRIVRKEKKGKWLVAIGPMKFPMDEKDLKPLSTKMAKERKKVSVSYESRSVSPRPTLDVRGMTLDEAIEAVSIQIEGALVHSMQSFSVIHGMGDGILAKGIHEYLGKVPQVANHYYARPEDGGYGKTYIELY